MFPALAAKLGGSLIWKGGAIVAMIASVVLLGFLIKLNYDNKSISKERDKLTQAIQDPVTGYIARLNTSRNNVMILTEAVRKQNSEFTRQSKASQAELTRLKAELKIAQAETAVYQRRVQALLGKPIEGKTLVERIEDVDARILKDLKK